jgi:hypothetical protein
MTHAAERREVEASERWEKEVLGLRVEETIASLLIRGIAEVVLVVT